MSAAIRQEINIICGTVTGTGTVTSNAIVQLDTGQFSGSPIYYFEAVYNGAASNTGTVLLRDLSVGSTAATLTGATSATYQCSRIAFTPGNTGLPREFTLQIVGDGVRTQTVHSARIIVLQSETGSATVMQTETQIEIGNEETGKTITAVADLTNPKYWKYTAANWSGSALTFAAEVVWATSAKNTATITLCRTSDNAANATIVSAGTNSTGYVRTRVNFTPVDGETYKIRTLGSTTKSNYSIACAKIIVAGATTSKDTIAAGGTTSSTYSAQGAGGTVGFGQGWTTTSAYSLYRLDIGLSKVGTPTDGLLVEVVSGSTNGTVEGSTTLTTPTPQGVVHFNPAISLANATKYFWRITRTGAADTSNYWRAGAYNTASVYANGGAFNDGGGGWGSESATNDLQFTSFTGTAPAKLEPQYLLLNKADSNATGLQDYLTKWTSSEWDAYGGTISYNHLMDSDNASNSIKLRDVTASADISNSTATGTGQITAAGTLGTFTTGNILDTWVLNTTGIIGAGRVLVLYSWAAAAVVVLPELITEVMVPRGWGRR